MKHKSAPLSNQEVLQILADAVAVCELARDTFKALGMKGLARFYEKERAQFDAVGYAQYLVGQEALKITKAA